MADLIVLPEPRYESALSLEGALLRRRSARRYRREPLFLGEISQILWAAQGSTSVRGRRTAPSAGATYPLQTYLAAGEVEGLEPGIYSYRIEKHALELITLGDKRIELCSAALGQAWVRDGAADMVIAANYERTTRRYGERGIRYVHMEAGHAQQNVHLQAASLKIGTVVVGAFDDGELRRILNMPQAEAPLSIMPLGRI